MDEKMSVRLHRLGEAERRSKEAHQDDVSARDTAIREADAAGDSVREIAAAVGMSASHVHRIASGLAGD